MDKKYLMKSMAALMLVASVSSCVSEVDEVNQTELNAAIKENAELQLGITIPEGQTWEMSTQVTTDIAINLGLDQSYTVGIYDENPLFNSDAKFYALEKVNEGEALNTSITLPNAASRVYIAVYDSKLRSVVHAVSVEDGKIVANIGGAMRGASMRAVESDYTDTYAKTLNDYLNPTLPATDQWGNPQWQTVKNLTTSEFSSYLSIDDDMIVNQTSQGNHTLTDASWSAGLGGDFIGHGDGKHFRIDKGTVINEVFHVNGAHGVVNDVVIYIEGTVHLNGNTLNGPTLVVADGGKIVLDGTTNMSNTGRFVVMPGGTIEGAEGVAFNVNNGGYCYNAGTIEFDGELNVNGSDVYNNGIIKVDVLRNTAGGKFTNFGHITARTNIGAGDSYNSTIINGCYMHYTEDAGIGSLTQLDNSRLDVGGMAEFNQDNQYLYNNSVIDAGSIWVNGTSFFGSDNTSDVAIIKTEKIIFAGNIYINQNKDDQYQTARWTWVARKVDGKGTIYLDWDPYETYGTKTENGVKVAGAKITDDNGYTMLSVVLESNYNYTSSATSAIIIPEGDCSGMGNNSNGGGGTIVGGPAVYTYAFEDQKVSGDYDMNDVVLKVSHPYTVNNDGGYDYDTSKLNCELVAAGATFNIRVLIGDRDLFGEIHNALGVNEGVMVNTGTHTNVVTRSTKMVQIDAPRNWNGDFTNLDVKIHVILTQGGNKPYDIEYKVENIMPYAIMIPMDWKWPTERTRVTDAYPNFITWAQTDKTQRTAAMNEWYKTPVSGKVMSNQ